MAYPEVVEKIHKEFYTTSDLVLQQAKAVLAKQNVAKAQSLINVGFTKAKEAKEYQEVSNETIQLIEQYQHLYPLYKFIDIENVIRICNKYNLVFGPIRRYKGFVPEKNLQQIEQFQKMSCPHIAMGVMITGFKNDFMCFAKNRKAKQLLKNKTYVNYSRCSANEYSLYKQFVADMGKRFDCISQSRLQYLAFEGLQICAPAKDMDMTGLKSKGRLFGHQHIPDPVVLQPVMGGFLIPTVWGDEASDPLVVNQLMN